MGGPAGRRLALAASALLVAAAFALALAGPERSSSGVAAAGPVDVAEDAEAPEPATSAPTVVADAEAPEAVERGEVARVATGDAASRRLVAQVYRVLPSAFLDEAEAEALGLRIVPNSFDNQLPLRGDALFTFPLPGQTPASVIVSEFFAAGFVAGHAQSFESVEASGPRVGAVAWAFATEAGAQRAFRALRDLSGRRSVPGTLRPHLGRGRGRRYLRGCSGCAGGCCCAWPPWCRPTASARPARSAARLAGEIGRAGGAWKGIGQT